MPILSTATPEASPTTSATRPAQGVKKDQTTSPIVGNPTTSVPSVATMKLSSDGSPPLLRPANGFAPGGGAGHCQRAPTTDPTPRLARPSPTASAAAGASSRHWPVVATLTTTMITISGRKTTMAASTRPARSSAPRTPDQACSQSADPS